ncbi:alpha/beta fold hydrolase [Vibrio ostreicida]|uniref:Alpha/beta hydrolase n=1 Tax=Vibrio ostreicida TaxID=526588 RepID=A0ABT8BSV0_9VIBR|nr:alpha/beta hydrolase [Vibrio ostreicida]MDN3610232.1 alpha/beta hydrolase [Vibrio ostreicida]NPD07750.1 alpha/beta hydrolase [Vibrio ostreicida]
MLVERWLELEGDALYCLSTPINKGQETLVLIHGLGDSHLCFADAIDWLPNYNLIMFDLCGYGYSPASMSSDDTRYQAQRILAALDSMSIQQCFVLGHSWGADTATLACELDTRGIVQGLINVEGGLHKQNIILSQIIAQHYSNLNEQQFSDWVKGEGFAHQFSLLWSHGAGVEYLCAVRRCKPSVLGKTATEIYAQHQTCDERGVVEWGRIYEDLSLPKIYFWGTRSLEGCDMAIEFIKTINNVSFEGAHHWVQSIPSIFYPQVDRFIQRVRMVRSA